MLKVHFYKNLLDVYNKKKRSLVLLKTNDLKIKRLKSYQNLKKSFIFL